MSWFRGLGRQPHPAACRERFAELLKNEARFKNALLRKEEYEEMIEKKRARKEKKKEDGNKDEEMHEPKGVKEPDLGAVVKGRSSSAHLNTIVKLCLGYQVVGRRQLAEYWLAS